MSVLWILPLVIAGGVTALLVRQFLVPGSRFHILDLPNERSLHDSPTPRTGGVALVTGFTAGAVILMTLEPSGIANLLVLLGTAIALGIVSFMDDAFQIPVRVRLAVHFSIAGVLVYLGYRIDAVSVPGFAWTLGTAASIIVSMVFIVWMINLYNFMDGMDGFAGGMTVIGFTTLAVLAAGSGGKVFSVTAGTIAAAAAGFLIFNFPPARVFLGDAGSSVLGLLAAAMSLWADRTGLIPLWISVLVFSPFVFDATFTLVRRFLWGEQVWVAHRTHLYQRLVQAGWSHRKTVVVEYGLMCGCASCAVLAMYSASVVQWVVAIAWVAIYIGMVFAVGRLEKPSTAPGN